MLNERKVSVASDERCCKDCWTFLVFSSWPTWTNLRTCCCGFIRQLKPRRNHSKTNFNREISIAVIHSESERERRRRNSHGSVYECVGIISIANISLNNIRSRTAESIQPSNSLHTVEISFQFYLIFLVFIFSFSLYRLCFIHFFLTKEAVQVG